MNTLEGFKTRAHCAQNYLATIAGTISASRYSILKDTIRKAIYFANVASSASTDVIGIILSAKDYYANIARRYLDVATFTGFYVYDYSDSQVAFEFGCARDYEYKTVAALRA